MKNNEIESGKSNSKGLVGLFWYYRKKVMGDFYSLDEADAYSNFLGPKSDHINFWPEIQKAHSELKYEEYEFVPRGRVLYDTRTKSFVIISSKKIIESSSVINKLRHAFKIPEAHSLNLMSDIHYEKPDSRIWND